MTEIILQGKRLRLRPFQPQDGPALHAYLNHPALTGRRYIPWQFPAFLPLSAAQVDALLQKWAEYEKQFHLAVVLLKEDKLIGHVNCDWGWDAHCPYLDLVISPDYMRQGYGSEVLASGLDYLYGYTPAHSIGGGMASWNEAGLQFALQNGFQQGGRMRRVGLRDGQYYDWIGVDILRPEWLARKGGA